MKPTAGRITHKIIVQLSRVFRGSIYRWILFSWIKFGKKIIFLGPIRCLGVSGQISIGDYCILGPELCISVAQGGAITIGSRCSINQGSFISALTAIRIGNRVRIGEYVSIRDNDHSVQSRTPIHDSGFISAAVEIGDDAWIGRCSTIMQGVKIGKGAIVGANSFVNCNVPEFTIVAGTPAKLIRVRSTD